MGHTCLLVIYIELIYHIFDAIFLLGILSPFFLQPAWKKNEKEKQSIHIDIGRASLLGYFAPWKHQGESSSELRIQTQRSSGFDGFSAYFSGFGLILL